MRYTKALLFSLIFHLFIASLVLYNFYDENELLKPIQPSIKRTTIHLSSFIHKKVQKAPIITKHISKKKRIKKQKKVQKKKRKKILKKIKAIPRAKKIVKKIEKSQPKVIKKVSQQEDTTSKIQKKSVEKKESKKRMEKSYIVNYIDNNLYQIRELIKDNLYYPRKARRKKITGEVVVKFRLKTNGKIDNIQVISSTHKILSRSAIRTIENLSSLLPKPKKEIIISLPIEYSLVQKSK